jgi:hypothetical protein
MKKTGCWLLAFIFLQSAFAQSYDPSDLVKFRQDTTSRVYISRIKTNQVYIPLEFNSAQIKDITAYREIKYNTILKVELVYSLCKSTAYFDQPNLNIQRLNVLKEAAPELFENSLTRWKFIAQTDFNTEDEARQLFHGFIITYRPEMTTAYNNDQFKSISYTVQKYINPNYDKSVRPVSYYGSVKRDVADLNIPPMIDIKDSVVLSVLKRNKDWKDMPVVCDVTGSMYPYITQTLIWYKLNCRATNAQQYTFFNDGDNTPDNMKLIGHSGGIYTGRALSYDSIENAMFKAMRNGTGGDSPENNIEALMQAISKFPQCKELVMIADNLANVKDISLLSKVNRPVHIILCGSYTGINVEYLNIARATGGSVHTIESDITNLMELNEGEYFVFKGQKFKVEKGRFKLVYGS